MKKPPLFAVFGASGCGRSVMPVAREQLARAGVASERLVFVDDNPGAAMINGQRLLSYEQFLTESTGECHAALAISDGVIREKIASRFQRDGVRPWTLQAVNAVIMDEVEIGAGALLSPFVTITSNIRIGRYFHANIYSYVEHDCRIGDYVTFAPAVKCNGNIVIEDHVYIGAGAMIKQGRTGNPLVIGRGAVVGMGAVVTKHVAPNEVVAGNPARPMRRS